MDIDLNLSSNDNGRSSFDHQLKADTADDHPPNDVNVAENWSIGAQLSESSKCAQATAQA
jgi:hypothetical protein